MPAAYVVLDSITQPNPSLGDGTAGVSCSWIIYNADGSILAGPAGPFVTANFSAGAAWADVEAAITSQLQADVGDPSLTVTFLPGSP